MNLINSFTLLSSSIISMTSSATASRSSPDRNLLASDAAEMAASPTSVYSPKSTCDSIGITNLDECSARCKEYFPESYNTSATFGPFVDGKLQDPHYCKCGRTGVISTDWPYLCGAKFFTCKQVNITDVETCDDVCKQDTSTPNTTFSGSWKEFSDSWNGEYSICECFADVPNSGQFNYCGGPSPPPSSGFLPTCGETFSEDLCEQLCRDHMRNDYPKYQATSDGEGVQCLCSTGAGCSDEVPSPSPSSGDKLGAWVSSLMMLTATVMVFSL